MVATYPNTQENKVADFIKYMVKCLQIYHKKSSIFTRRTKKNHGTIEQDKERDRIVVDM